MLLALLALALLAPAPLHLSREGRRVAIPMTAEVQAAGGKPLEVPLVWHADGPGAVVASAGTPSWSLRVSIAPGGGAGAELTATLTHLRAFEVDHEELRLRLPGHARAVDRTLAWTEVPARARVDRGTPVIVATADVAVQGEDGVIAARYESRKETTDVALILDDVDAHPFEIYQDCLNKLPEMIFGSAATPTAAVESSAETFAELEKKKPLPAIQRAAGDTLVAHATLIPLDPSAPLVPVIPERWPAGARAAVVFTDHADRTDPPALRAMLYGTSDEKAADYGTKGFFGHGLAITKSFFSRAVHGGLATDPQAAALADEIVAHGSEVASHSPSNSPDLRPAVEASIPVFAKWKTVTWIDHEPYTNCEAISTLGWEKDGRWGIRELLQQGGYRWLWTATDVAGFRRLGLANLFDPRDPARAESPIFAFPPDPRMTVFRSSWFAAAPDKLGAALNAAALEALERDRGIFVAHTYLSASTRTTRSAELKKWLTVRDGKRGVVTIDPAFDAGLARLGERVKAGSIASMTWQAAGDRLVALEGVRVLYLPGGDVRIENHSPDAIAGLTLAVPEDAEIELLEEAPSGDRGAGAPPEPRATGARSANEPGPTQLGQPGRTETWLDLPAGGAAMLEVRHKGVPAPRVAGTEGTAAAP